MVSGKEKISRYTKKTKLTKLLQDTLLIADFSKTKNLAKSDSQS
jgi:hypothetical protein